MMFDIDDLCSYFLGALSPNLVPSIRGEKQPPKQSSEADGRGALKHVGSPDDHPRWKFSVNIRDIV